MKRPQVAIIIPAHNEELTIGGVITIARNYGKVIVVNDSSNDNTEKISKKCGAHVLTHKENKGLGASLRDGFKKALELNQDIIITMDADGQHNPYDIPRFVSAVEAGNGFVLGSRNLSRYPFIKKFGNFFLNTATNFISGTNLKDTESGFRAFTKVALEKLCLKGNRYEIAVEIIFEIGRNKIKSVNIPIKSPIYVKGVGVLDGFRNFTYLLQRRERTWMSYVQDTRYVLKKHFWL